MASISDTLRSLTPAERVEGAFQDVPMPSARDLFARQDEYRTKHMQEMLKRQPWRGPSVLQSSPLPSSPNTVY